MSAPVRAQGPGRPKDMEKRAAVLRAAKQLFTDQGFEGTSMDAVAQAAKVSKLTVYSHFGDKDTLFREAIRQRCQELIPDDLYTQQDGVPLRQALLNIAMHHVRLVTSSESLGTWRAITSDMRSGSPRLGRMLWDAGPARTHALVETFLRCRVETDGDALEITDVPRAAEQLLALIKGDLHFRCMFGCVQNDCAQFEADLVAHTEAAVDMFLRAYAPRGRT